MKCILVLSDLKDEANATLNGGVGLAKMLGAEIDFFCVKNASDVVDGDNQLSAMRTINQNYTKTDKIIKTLIKSATKNNGIKINYAYAFGHVKHEIKNRIKQTNPDIVVLGKRKSNVLNISRNNTTSLVLKQFNGPILIVDDSNNALTPTKNLVLGILNGSENTFNSKLVSALKPFSETTLKSFVVGDVPSNGIPKQNTVEYVFEANDNTIGNLKNYISKNHINLLLLDRTDEQSNNKTKPNIKTFINKLNVSVLLTSQLS
ncbi:MAG: universal stress protein [Aestuariibaculum sp.]